MLAVVLLCGCMNEAAKQTLDEYSKALEQAQKLEHLVSTADFSVFTGKVTPGIFMIDVFVYEVCGAVKLHIPMARHCKSND